MTKTITGNITDTDCYKLDAQLTGFPDGTNHIEISRWIPETGWIQLELFLSDVELTRLQQALRT
jgi:hypothetical protein